MFQRWRTHSLWAGVIVLIASLSLVACFPAHSPSQSPTGLENTAAATAAKVTETALPAPTYKTFNVPGPEPASFELPADWAFWGNGGWLSPDQGQTLGGLRLTFLKPGQDAGRLLYNEAAVLIDQSPVTVSDAQLTRYKVQSFSLNASTGQKILEGYELIYALPLEQEQLMAGVFIRAQSQEELEQWEPVVRHMVESLRVGKK